LRRTPRAALAARVARAGAGDALKGTRACWFEGDRVEADVYAGGRLAAGTVFDGPAIVEEQGTTMVVPPGFSCEADRAGGYVLRNHGAGGQLAAAGAEREERS
jgi:N-methylhydantoinase A/oxoprolinase/acetone carboxylase beta subunit